jgi:hypothetical protein
LSIVVAVVLAIVVVVTLVVAIGGSGGKKHLTVVRGVIGSEKQAFFTDPRVKAAFAHDGYDVQVDTAGSRQIATTVDLSKYDFAFPAGTPAAEKIRRDHHTTTSYVPFFTPMAIATFTPIAQLLAKEGVAHDHGGYWSLDMKGFVSLVDKGLRWKDIPGNTTYPNDNFVLVTSTDIATSNSSAMYASILSYVANGDAVIDAPAQADKVLSAISPAYLEQGYTEQSTEAPFDDYLSIGIGKTPMVMIYEAQYVDRAALHDGSIRPDMVLMYPDPDIESKHTVVPLTANGDAIGKLLTNDPTLQQLAVDNGFRTSSPTAFAAFVQKNHVDIAPQLLNIIEPPTYESLEALITKVDAALHRTFGAAYSPHVSDSSMDLSDKSISSQQLRSS